MEHAREKMEKMPTKIEATFVDIVQQQWLTQEENSKNKTSNFL